MFESMEKKNIHGQSTDIWALGVTMFFMLSGQYPHQDVGTNLEEL